MKLPHLQAWRSRAFRSAPEQMAIDDLLLRHAIRSGIPCARFYTWDRPACTIGYFSRWESATSGAKPGEVPVRRLTGGGRVEHGEDATFCLAIPASCALAKAPTAERYRWIHGALLRALAEAGIETALAPDGSAPEDHPSPDPGACFANPVSSDLLDPFGGKIAGGAQRRSRGALIHQGSVRLAAPARSPDSAWIDVFLEELAEEVEPFEERSRARILQDSAELVAGQYGASDWNRRR